MAPQATKQAKSKLTKEYKSLCERLPEGIEGIHMKENDLLEWHFLLCGPSATPLEGGRFVGRINWDPDHPYKPPRIFMLTPNGRFEVNKPICTSFSSYHPEEWSPMWRVESLLLGLRSFMAEQSAGVGGLNTSAYEKQRLAHESIQWNKSQSKLWSMFQSALDQAEPPPHPDVHPQKQQWQNGQSRQEEREQRRKEPPAEQAADDGPETKHGQNNVGNNDENRALQGPKLLLFLQRLVAMCIRIVREMCTRMLRGFGRGR